MRNRTSTISLRNTRARRGRTVLMVAATTGLFGAGLLASVAPASAQVLDTDHPRATAGSHAFGKNWVLGAPVNGGDLTWDLTNGITTATTTGYHYLTDKHCGRVFIEYFNSNHTSLGTDTSSSVCAPGNGKTQWWVSESFASPTVTHVHVSVQHQNSNGTFTTVATDTEDFN